MNSVNHYSQDLVSLGELYVSDFISNESDARAGKHDLTLVFDQRYGSVRLKKTTPIHSMFGKYWYRSGINTTMKNELNNIVQSICHVHKLKDDDLWLDIACNDGTLLSFVPSTINKLGIDPAEDSFFNESSKIADEVIQDFFSKKSYERSVFKDRKANVITVIAMFYDLDEPIRFLNDIVEVLEDDGLLVMQMSYTPLMIKQLAFDNICHEHVYYWSLNSITRLLNEAGLRVVDCQINDVNGGSFRLYIKKSIANEKTFATAPYRDVCSVRIESISKWEDTLQLESLNTWKKFYDDIENLKQTVASFIKKEKENGKTICGYGASTKGNTLLQYFGLDNSLITAIAERSSYKYGLKTIGTNIPILSEEEVRSLNPDYMLVLPWHFIDEFITREEKYLSGGGKFIVPCPKFDIITKR